ncbi:MAG: reprolysin-like metallopeptidase [Saprospiraceae bacterium]
MKIKLTLLLTLLTNFLIAQSSLWQDVAKSELPALDNPEKELNLRHARSLQLKFTAMRNLLAKAPLENTTAARRNPLRLELPMPDGSMQWFEVIESPVMEPGLAAKFPDIQSFKIVHQEHKTITGRIDISPVNFHAMIDWNNRAVFIDPAVWTNNEFYHAYFEDEVNPGAALACGVPAGEHIAEYLQAQELDAPVQTRDATNTALDLRTFRIAISTTGEFAQRFGGTTMSVLSAINTVVNRANQVFERDVAIRLILINNNERLISLDPATDPYTNSNQGRNLIQQQVQVFGNVFRISFQEYDLGHVFTGDCDDVGGIASLGVCGNARAAGVSCFRGGLESTALRVFAHEVGHQFSASHTFGSGCDPDQLSPSTAFEPVCGSSIMSYSGNPIPFFHSFSIQQITNYSRTGTGSGCASIVQVQNNEPELTLNYPNGFYIPIQTPFELNATTTDADNDPLTYSWEQLDPDGALFPMLTPSNNPKRVFPNLNSILNDFINADGRLPDTTRDMSFRCLVRDNRTQAGASVWKDVKFKATKEAGPFRVTFPNDDTVQWTAGAYVEVRWDVANTDKALVNCKSVNILLSTDGGLTFPIVLAQNAPNTGTAKIPVPEVATNRARVRIEAADNIFFDISNRNFQIWPATRSGFTLNATPRGISQQCLPQPLQFTVQTDDILGFNTPLTLSVEGNLPTDAVVTFAKNPVAPSEATTLTIQFKTQIEGTFNLELKATANNVSQSIPLSFSTVSNDFSQLALLQPVNGASNIGISTSFAWRKSPNANTYDFELATSPTFGNTVIASVSNLQDTTYMSNQLQFEENRLYFWRVRPVNECGKGAFLEPSVFRTAAVSCASTASANVPVNISASGLPTVNSVVNIPTQGIINDINIPQIRINYETVRNLRLTLISPAGTEVILYDQSCTNNTTRLETGFDDEAPGAIVCPPANRTVVRPVQALSAFKGQNTAGTWTLRTRVVTAGGGGSIQSWNIEFCSTLSPNNPSLLKNDTLKVPPGKTNTYTRNQLEVTDTDNTPTQLTYLLVTLPQHGTLLRGGAPLQVGSTFTQAEINNFQLQYTHNGNNATFDSFLFVVEDGTGGWLPTQRANIQIDANATVGVNDLLNDNAVMVYPNPTRDLLNVQFNELPKGAVLLSLFNAQGQEVQRERFDYAAQTLQLNTNQLPSGMYFLTVRTAEGMATKKVTIQH